MVGAITVSVCQRWDVKNTIQAEKIKAVQFVINLVGEQSVWLVGAIWSEKFSLVGEIQFWSVQLSRGLDAIKSRVGCNLVEEIQFGRCN